MGLLRRDFVKRLGLGAAALAAAGTALAAPRKKRPNFIIFYTDDQGWTDTSVRMMNARRDSRSYFYQTPHLERLAKRGMKFSNAYSPAPTCTPSRISIQFGKTPARLKQTVVHDVLAKANKVDCRGEVSMAQVLKQADSRYITAHFGKGIAIKRIETLGYDVHDEFDTGDNGNYHGDYVSIKDRSPLPEDDPKRIFSLTRRAVKFVKDQAQAERPFFMMVSHYAVHVHHRALRETIEKYRKLPRGEECSNKDYEDPATFSEGYRNCAWALQYAAMIENLDSSLGAIMDVVDEAGIRGETYIVFTSDNGGGFAQNKPLSGGKAKILDGGLRVPTVVAGPGVLADTQCDVPVVQWDLLTTLHDLSGSAKPLPRDVDGGSWRSVLTQGNKGQVERPHAGLVFNYPYYAGVPVEAIRVGDYKFMRQLNTGEIRLHDLVDDIGEKTNLAKSMPERAAELDGMLQAYLKDVDAEKIGDMVRARFVELEGYKKQVYANVAKHKALIKSHPADKAKHDKRVQELLTQEIPRLDRQIQDTKRNMALTGWE